MNQKMHTNEKRQSGMNSFIYPVILQTFTMHVLYDIQDMQNFIDSEMDIFPSHFSFSEIEITLHFWCPTIITGSVFFFLIAI